MNFSYFGCLTYLSTTTTTVSFILSETTVPESTFFFVVFCSVIYLLASYDTSFHWELGACLSESFLGNCFGDTVYLKEHTACTNCSHISLEVSLSFTKLHFGWLRGVWHIWEDTDP